MSELQCVARLKIHDGKLDEFKRLAAKYAERRPVRRGAPREPEHSNEGVLTPRSGRILRHD
jgi:hypothetical protein